MPDGRHFENLFKFGVLTIGGGSIYKVGGPDAERRRRQRDGEGLRGGVRNL